MSWETKTVMEQRKGFIIAASAEDANISKLCREFGISRKTGHKWINRAEMGLPYVLPMFLLTYYPPLHWNNPTEY